MDKKIAMLLGAAAALTATTAANAATPQQAEFGATNSYQDLLAPVPNPIAALNADNARLAAEASGSGLQLAQFFYHHHHHHHNFAPWWWHRRFYHHHHHHHHHGVFFFHR